MKTTENKGFLTSPNAMGRSVAVKLPVAFQKANKINGFEHIFYGTALNQYHEFAVWGWGTALSELHYQYRIVPEWKLNAATLQTLKVLIIPNASVFDPVNVPALQTWVSNGGCLIVTGNSGSLLGESGNFATTNNPTLSSLTGVSSYSPMPAVATTNFIGSGAVYYSSNNIGYTFYNASGSSRVTQLPAFATVVSNAFNWVNTQPVLVSTNAPATVGLTLYNDTNSAKTFLDLNNMNVDTNTYVTTPSPIVDVTLTRPAWLTNGLPAAAFVISPDGVSNVLALDVAATNLHLRLPSVTNYLSVILQPAPGFGAWGVDAGGNWGNSNNWSSVIVPSGISSTAIFSNGITASRVVTNEIARTVGNLIFGDASPGSPAGWVLSGASALTLQVSNGTPAITLAPLGAGASLTLAVPLAGNQGLALNGVGNLNVTATNTYTGATILGATPGGALSVLLNGGKISSAATVTVQTNVALGGNGVIIGAVSIQPGATLQPGLGGLDTSTLSVSNSLTLAGSTIITLNRTNAQNAVRVAGLSAVTYGGTLLLTNVGPPLQAGDVLTNFTAASYGGSFSGIFPATPGAGLAWDTSKLLVNGSVAVAALPTVSILPATTNIALGGNVTLTASAGGTTPLSYRWFDNATNFIAGATNSALTITNPSPSAAGNYTVVVTNLYGSATNWATVGINPLFIFSSTFSGGNFVVGGSGPDGNSYRILTTTNLILPLTNWMPAVTGIFSGGQFWFTDSVSTNLLQRFYRIAVP